MAQVHSVNNIPERYAVDWNVPEWIERHSGENPDNGERHKEDIS